MFLVFILVVGVDNTGYFAQAYKIQTLLQSSNDKCFVMSTENLLLSTEHSVLSTESRELSTKYQVLITGYW